MGFDPVSAVFIGLITGVMWLVVWRLMRLWDVTGVQRAVILSLPMGLALSLVVNEVITVRTGGNEPDGLRRIRGLLIMFGVPFVTYVWVTRRSRR